MIRDPKLIILSNKTSETNLMIKFEENGKIFVKKKGKRKLVKERIIKQRKGIKNNKKGKRNIRNNKKRKNRNEVIKRKEKGRKKKQDLLEM